MSVRFRILHEEVVGKTLIRYRADIVDSQYSAAITEKVTTGRFFEWDYPKIDQREPFEKPVQKSSFTIDLRVTNDGEFSLLSDILDADEDRFKINFYIDGVHKWSGKVLTDLIEYPEAPKPWAGKIKAKDLSGLEGVDFDFVELPTLTRLSVIIAECLQQTGLGLPIRSYTNLTNADITDQSQDFLFALFHQKFALRNKDAPLTCLEVLETICRAYNLIIRQSDARWIIEQLPAVAKGDAVQFDYDSNGLNPVSSTPDRTVRIDRIDSFLLPSSTNKVTGALKSVTSFYKHRVLIFNIDTENVHHTSSTQFTRFSLDFDDDGNFRFAISVDAEAITTSGLGDDGVAYFRVIGVRPGFTDVYLDQVTNSFSTGRKEVEIPLTGVGSPVTGSLNIVDAGPFGGDVATVIVEFLWAEVTDSAQSQQVSEVNFTAINALLFNQSKRDWQATISHKYTRSGSFSATEEISETLLGDGPTEGDNFASKGRPATDNFVGAQVVPGRFKIRGVSEGLSLEEITLRERINMRRDALRNIRASLWMKYSPENLIWYDGGLWFFLGGRFTAKRTRWDANILKLDYNGDATGDVINAIAEEGGDPSGASEGTPSSGTGVSLEDGDARWLNETANLGDLDDAAAAIANLGITATTAELNILDGATLATAELNKLDGLTATTAELNQLDGNIFTSKITGTSANFSGALDADTLRPDTGKFLSPVSYAFRNAVDTGYRDLQAAHATFAGLTSNGNVIINSLSPNTTSENGLAIKDPASDQGIFFGQATSVGFIPFMTGKTLGDAGDHALLIGGEITPANDTGLAAIIRLNARRTDITTVASRNLFEVLNNGSSRFLLSKDGGIASISSAAVNAPLTPGSTLTVGGSADVQGELTANSIETSRLRTTLFKPGIISGFGGESAWSAVSQVTAIDTTNTASWDGKITFEDAIFSAGDYIAVSSADYNAAGFSNTRIQLKVNIDGKQFEYAVVTGAGGEADISVGDTGVRANGNMVYVDARTGTANGPLLEGYQNLANFTDSPLGDGGADPVWQLRSDGGVIGGYNIDPAHFWTEDGLGGAGTFSGLIQRQAATTKVFFGGADDKDGLNANTYLRADGFLFSPSISDQLIGPPIDYAPLQNNPPDATTPTTTDTANWSVTATQTGPTNSPTISDAVVVAMRIRKRPGTTKLKLIFWAKRESSQVIGGGGNGGATTEVHLRGSFITNSVVTITNTTNLQRYETEAEFDPADLFNDTERFIDIYIYAEANVAAGSASDFSQTAETYLDKDLLELHQSV